MPSLSEAREARQRLRRIEDAFFSRECPDNIFLVSVGDMTTSVKVTVSMTHACEKTRLVRNSE
eukprot:1219315-Amphidinium_carterae.1